MSRLIVLASLVLLSAFGAGVGAAPALADIQPCISTGSDRTNYYCVTVHVPIGW